MLTKTTNSSSTTVSASVATVPVAQRIIATAVVATMATHGVRRRGRTRAATVGNNPCRAIP